MNKNDNYGHFNGPSTVSVISDYFSSWATFSEVESSCVMLTGTKDSFSHTDMVKNKERLSVLQCWDFKKWFSSRSPGWKTSLEFCINHDFFRSFNVLNQVQVDSCTIIASPRVCLVISIKQGDPAAIIYLAAIVCWSESLQRHLQPSFQSCMSESSCLEEQRSGCLCKLMLSSISCRLQRKSDEKRATCC